MCIHTVNEVYLLVTLQARPVADQTIQPLRYRGDVDAAHLATAIRVTGLADLVGPLQCLVAKDLQSGSHRLAGHG